MILQNPVDSVLTIAISSVEQVKRQLRQKPKPRKI
jgi:hypothetical protein